MTNGDWQNWKFPQLVEAYPLNHKLLSENNRANPYRNPNKVYHANQHQTECVYCKKSDHNSSDCQTDSKRRKLLSENELCLNCAKPKHDCRSSKTCLICKNKH